MSIYQTVALSLRPSYAARPAPGVESRSDTIRAAVREGKFVPLVSYRTHRLTVAGGGGGEGAELRYCPGEAV